MEYPKSQKYCTPGLLAKIMGPNPFKLQEEMLQNHQIPAGSVVCDLGSGQGLTSVMLAKDYGFTVYAADLWSDPEENRRFFDEMGQRRAPAMRDEASRQPNEAKSISTKRRAGRNTTMLK